MRAGGLRLVTAILVAAAFGAGCGGEDVDIDILPTVTPGSFVSSTPARTSTPGASIATRTVTPAGTSTSVATPTGTPGGSSATSGGPTPSPTPGGVSQSVETTVDDLLAFFSVAGLTTGVASASAQQAVMPFVGIGMASQAAAKVDACPNGGTRTQDDQLTTVIVTLAACKFSDPDLGSFQFDGTITANLVSATVAFNVTAKDLNSNRTVTFAGSVSGTPASGGGFVVDGGPILLTTPQRQFTLTLDHLTVDGDGNVVAGGGSLTDDDDVFDLQKIELTIRTGGLLADLVVTFDDDSTASFVIDLKKGSITPAD
jgi:hypothetical protein